MSVCRGILTVLESKKLLLERRHKMSQRTPFPTVLDYPRGLMNECVCGQVVLAPRTSHINCEWCDRHNEYRVECEGSHT